MSPGKLAVEVEWDNSERSRKKVWDQRVNEEAGGRKLAENQSRNIR